MKKLVIFDLDGTLLNTIADLANATNYALEKLGFPQHDMNEYHMMGLRSLNDAFLPVDADQVEIGGTNLASYLENFNPTVTQNITYTTTVKPIESTE